jgi:hypothetical protein
MFMRKIILILLLISPILFLPHCEKITGYNYDVKPLNNTVRVYGVVKNAFTGRAVEDALVEIGIQTTSTDIYGQYEVQYILGTAENRDQPVPVVISAPNYEILHTSFIIYPEPTRVDFQLVYAAPIIEKNALFATMGSNWYCQAIVKDFQGVNDIKKVTASFYYVKPNSPDSYLVSYEFILIGSVNNITGRYQISVPPTYRGDYYLYIDRYQLEAEDYEGHIHQKIGYTSKVVPDTALFPVSSK